MENSLKAIKSFGFRVRIILFRKGCKGKIALQEGIVFRQHGVPFIKGQFRTVSQGILIRFSGVFIRGEGDVQVMIFIRLDPEPVSVSGKGRRK